MHNNIARILYTTWFEYRWHSANWYLKLFPEPLKIDWGRRHFLNKHFNIPVETFSDFFNFSYDIIPQSRWLKPAP